MKFRDQKGFTLIDLAICVVMVLVVISIFSMGIMIIKGNFWYTEAGVLNDIRIDHPEASQVLRSHNNIVNYSTFEIENNDGTRAIYELDTNVLFNYSLQKTKSN